MQPSPLQGTPAAENLARDLGSAFLIRLGVHIKSLRLYGLDHPRRAHSLRELAGITGQITARHEQLGILARKDTLTIYLGDEFCEIATPMARDFLQRSIRYLQIRQGVDPPELESVAMLLADKPEAVRAAGGALKYLQERGATHVEGMEFRCDEKGRVISDIAAEELSSSIRQMLERTSEALEKPLDRDELESLQELMTDGEISAELATLCSLFGSLEEGSEGDTRTIDLFELLLKEVAGLDFEAAATLDENAKSVLQRLLGLLKGKMLERLFGMKKRGRKRPSMEKEVKTAGGVLPFFLGRSAVSDLLPPRRRRERAAEPPPEKTNVSLAELAKLSERRTRGKVRPGPTTKIAPDEIPGRVKEILRNQPPFRLDLVEEAESALSVADELRRSEDGGNVSRSLRSIAGLLGRLEEKHRDRALDAVLASAFFAEDGGSSASIFTDVLLQPFEPRLVALRVLEYFHDDPARCRNGLRAALRHAELATVVELAEAAEGIEGRLQQNLLREVLAEIMERSLTGEVEHRIAAASPADARRLLTAIYGIPSPGCRDLVARYARSAPPDKRGMALKIVGTAGGEEDLAPVLEAAGDRSAAIRRLAISILAGRPDAAAVEKLCEIAGTDTLLGRNLDERLLAIDALARQGSLAGVEVLRELADKRFLFRGKAARELRDRARAALRRALAAKGEGPGTGGGP